MSDYVRTQVLLERKQRQQLDEIANKTGLSFSELVREMLESELRKRTYEEMRRAAEVLQNDYLNDEQLTDFTALDGEAFLNVQE